MNGTVTCVGIAVKEMKRPVNNLFVKNSTDKVLVGVPYQGAFPIDTIKQYLIENNYINEEDVIGVYVFRAEMRRIAA